MNKAPLGQLCTLFSGGTPSTKIPEYWDGDILWLSSAESGNAFIYDSKTKITQKGVENSATKLAKKHSVIIATAGEGKTRGQVSYLETDAYINQSLIALNSKKEITNLYLYYFLKGSYSRLRKLSGITGVRGSLSGELLKGFEIRYPEITEQNRITSLLRTIDAKIENNNFVISQLESLAKMIYDYWFLQFEFPNEKGKPYKSSGGKMVWNDELKREIPEGWEVRKYCEIANTVTGKEDANFATENGPYAYFTCGSDILKCDEYKFDGKAILIAGNGDFNVKYYDGKFNAYQRTYVLMPDEKYIGILYQATSRKINQFKSGSNGSIVKFITKGDVDGIELIIPNNEELLTPLNTILDTIQHNKRQNQELAFLRDFLLPMLMNGQVTFKD